MTENEKNGAPDPKPWKALHDQFTHLVRHGEAIDRELIQTTFNLLDPDTAPGGEIVTDRRMQSALDLAIWLQQLSVKQLRLIVQLVRHRMQQQAEAAAPASLAEFQQLVSYPTNESAE